MPRYTPPKDKRADYIVQLADGVLVQGDVLNVVEKIQAYDPNLRVKFLDPRRADAFDAPYQITEMCPDGVERIVFGTWELTEETFRHVVAADAHRNGMQRDILAEIDASNAKLKVAKEKEQREIRDALIEFTAAVLGSRKDTYSGTNPVTGQKHVFRSVPKSED